jgi:hypothetical protein
MSDITRGMIDALLPPGKIWVPAIKEQPPRGVSFPGDDLDNLLQGIAWNLDILREYLADLATLRDPLVTAMLIDLEREFGFLSDTRLDEETRRQRLLRQAYATPGNATEADLEYALQMAGFDVNVYQNDPAVDPSIFLDQSFQMVAGGANAYAGRADAFAGRLGGELLVNGDIFTTGPLYEAVAGTFYAGDGTGAGFYQQISVEEIIYPIPTDPASWPFIFFVGGPATRDPGTNELTAIEQAEIPIEREQEFKRLILQIKPLFTWAALIVVYT